jgi:hypothetical protein
MTKKKRDYKKEYETYHASEEQKTRRAQRNKSRREMEEKGKVHKGDGKDVDHKNRNTAQGGSNLRVRSRSSNRSHGGKVGSRAGKARGGRN